MWLYNNQLLFQHIQNDFHPLSSPFFCLSLLPFSLLFFVFLLMPDLIELSVSIVIANDVYLLRYLFELDAHVASVSIEILLPTHRSTYSEWFVDKMRCCIFYFNLYELLYSIRVSKPLFVYHVQWGLEFFNLQFFSFDSL